jgi:hypothetical protein
MSWLLDWATPHAIFHTKYHILAVWRMMTLPNISDSGPKNRGPMAYARTKMDSVICVSISFWIPNSFAIAVRAGATIDEETGEIKVKHDTTKTAAHLFLIGQFFGLSGSSGPRHVI